MDGRPRGECDSVWGYASAIAFALILTISSCCGNFTGVTPACGCAPTIMQLLAPLAQSAGTDGLDEGSMNMMKKMIMEMPLKSLVSVIPGDQVELLIQQMNLLLAQ